MHFLYQFSLQFFLEIFQCVLYENPKLKGMKDPQQRLKVLSGDLFQVSTVKPFDIKRRHKVGIKKDAKRKIVN